MGRCQLFFALACMASPAFAEEANDRHVGSMHVLDPNSPWVLDLAEDSCALRRAFGDPEELVHLELRQFSPSVGYQLTLAARNLKIKGRVLEYRFAPATSSIAATDFSSAAFSDGLTGVVFDVTLHPDPPKVMRAGERFEQAEDGEAKTWSLNERNTREAEITLLEIEQGLDRPIRLKTGSLGPPMEAMRACMDDLVAQWSLPPQGDGPLARPAKPKDMKRWAKALQSAYPGEALSKELSGIVRVRIMVGADGKPTSCHLQVPTQHDSFRRSACEGLMKHARFEPAKDSSGNPIPGYYVTKITYALY